MNTTESESTTISSDEHLARFILFSGWIRQADHTVKPDAFIPYPHSGLSVTRHTNLTEMQVWEIGRMIATMRQKKLYGQADLSVATVRQQTLEVEHFPVQENPNHAEITGWPIDKPAQKAIALELAAASTYRKSAI